MKINNQKGFSALDVILVIVALAAIGAAVYFAVHNHKATAKAAVIATASTSPQPTSSDPYAGWKTYTSSYQSVSFMYPSSWVIGDEDADANEPGTSAQEFTLTSSSGYKLYYSDAVAGLGGACDPSQADVNLTAVNHLANTNAAQPVYLVQSGSELGLDTEDTPPVVGSTGSCIFYPLILGNKTGTQIELASDGEFSNTTPEALPARQTQDFATAKLILESFKYDN